MRSLVVSLTQPQVAFFEFLPAGVARAGLGIAFTLFRGFLNQELFWVPLASFGFL